MTLEHQAEGAFRSDLIDAAAEVLSERRIVDTSEQRIEFLGHLHPPTGNRLVLANTLPEIAPLAQLHQSGADCHPPSLRSSNERTPTARSAVAATLAWLADRYPASTVAAAVGADKPAVIGWANGTTRPTGVQVARLATLAAVPVDVFYRHPEP